MGPFNHPIFEKLVAPKIRDLEPLVLPIIDPSIRPHPLKFAITASVLNFDQPTLARLSGFVVRARHAYDEYLRAGDALRQHFDQKNSDTVAYFDSVYFLSNVVGQLALAHQLLSGVRKADFREDHGKKVGRINGNLYRIYNDSKHFEGTLRRHGGAQKVLPVWLESDGLASTSTKLEYEELAFLVRDACLAAQSISRGTTWLRSLEGEA